MASYLSQLISPETLEAWGTYLPPHAGLLPKWLLLVGVTAIGNSIQTYSTLTYTTQIYSGAISPTNPANPVNDLSARTFGTWSFLSAVIRCYAAYNIANPVVYEIALWSYVVAFGHFMSEWLWYRTANWGRGLTGPVLVSTGSLIWMWAQWGFYVDKAVT